MWPVRLQKVHVVVVWGADDAEAMLGIDRGGNVSGRAGVKAIESGIGSVKMRMSSGSNARRGLDGAQDDLDGL